MVKHISMLALTGFFAFGLVKAIEAQESGQQASGSRPETKVQNATNSTPAAGVEQK